MSNVRLIAFDLDGTLLDNDKKIPETSIDAISRLRKNGLIVTLVTGRPLYSTLSYVEQLDLDSYFSVSDSSIVLNRDGNILKQLKITDWLMRQVLDICRKHNCRIVWAVNRGMIDDFMISQEDYEDLNMREFITVESRIYNLELDLLKIKSSFDPDDLESYMIFVLGLKKDIWKLEDEIRDFADRITLISNVGLNPIYHHNLVNTHGLLISRPAGANKLEGLKTICDHYGIDVSETMFFGDWYNDVDTLNSVGYPVLMENAPFEIHNESYYITGSHEKNGISHALQNFGLI